MGDSLAVVLPVFGLIGLGYLARRFGLLSDRAGDGLSEFVFSVAVPCLLFRTLLRSEIPAVQPWGYWVSYFTAVAIVWGLAMLAARQLFRLSGTPMVVAGFAAGQSNTVLVGVPLILKAYGEAGAVPLFLLIAVHLPVMMIAATLLAEGRSASPASLARRLFTHPILLGILLGIAAKPLAPAIPEPLWRMVDLLAGAAIPCALVGMGVALRRYGLQAGVRLPVLISALKLLLQPLIVFLLATRVFSMPPAWSGVAVLFAACPCGINAYLLAEHYREGVALASSAVALSTALALGTTLFWLSVLGV
jgi:malonate transporter and related proteins